MELGTGGLCKTCPRSALLPSLRGLVMSCARGARGVRECVLGVAIVVSHQTDWIRACKVCCFGRKVKLIQREEVITSIATQIGNNIGFTLGTLVFLVLFLFLLFLPSFIGISSLARPVSKDGCSVTFSSLLVDLWFLISLDAEE